MGLSFDELLREVLSQKEMRVLIAGLVTTGLSFAMLSMFFPKKVKRILMVGRYGAGKTTILYKLKRGRVVRNTPFYVFEYETAHRDNMLFNAYDLFSNSALCIRSVWAHYFQNTQGLIFVVNSNDRSGIDNVRKELHWMLNEDEFRDVVLLVFANKQDLPNAMTAAEITDKLGLHSLCQRHWYIQSTCATSGKGLYEGLDWLSSKIDSKA